MKDLIDIHSHILPGVDDGSDNYETSIRMLGRAAKDGISGMILTPHNKPGRRHISFSKLSEKLEKLQNMMRERDIDIDLYIGNELYYRSGILEELQDGTAVTLADSHYVLVEFNPLENYDYIRNGIYSLLMDGYYPILAHVERYRNVCGGNGRVDELVEMGCYIQANAASVMGQAGWGTKRFLGNLLKRRQVHFIATDAHDPVKRAPCLAECARYIGKKYGEDYGRKLFYENPLCVTEDEDIAL